MSDQSTPSNNDAAKTLLKNMQDRLLAVCQAVGHSILSFFQSIGALSMFVGKSVQHCFTPTFYPRLILRQFVDIGYCVTEQIDALVTLSVNPFKYLIAPRVIAGTLMLPILVLIGDIIGIYGGYIVSIYNLGFSSGNYINQTWDILERMDVLSGLIKAGVFGFIVSVMGCYHGFNSGRGAQGVGTATTYAVVSASILILIFNYILTQVFFS